MSRVIKFRAWDSEGFMHHSSDLDVSEDYIIAFDSGVMHLYHVDSVGNYDELKIMQFTGLTDKNGMEIYEGDIIENVSNLVNIYGEKRQGKSVKRFRVGWHDKGSWNSFDDTSDEHTGIVSVYEPSKWSEVIGNIYENPELL